MKFTPLKDEHVSMGAKMVDFAGWFMPVEYIGMRLENLHVRSKVGLFDVSHMGEVRVRGPKALETLQWLTTNDVSKLKKNSAQYSLLPNKQGGIVDDIIIYCIEPESDYLVCVNASNADKDFRWMSENNRGAEITNESDKWGQIAVQGPRAVELVAKVFAGSTDLKNVASFHFATCDFKGGLCYVARTGYTGEDGFEIFVPAGKTVDLWRALLATGSDVEARPIGLGARDTLRTEMKYSLYGQEIDDETNPYEAGLGWVVKPDAKDFIGKEKIMAVKAAGLKHKLVGFQMLDKGIARHHYGVLSIDKREIGKVTSGTVSPTSGESIGIAYVATEFAKTGQEIGIDIRGRAARAKIVETPFIKRK
jgi:aminomethyltransferase